MALDESDLALLIALQENPITPASKLAKAVNLSTPTVISKLESLKYDKSYYSVFAHLHSDILNLEIVDVLIEADRFENVDYFEKEICYNHPYTLFRIRCFGNFNGFYLQFRIPINSHPLLIDLLDHLKREGKIKNYFILIIPPNTLTTYTTANLSNWEARTMRWNFDWEHWIKKLDKSDSKRKFKTTGKSLLSKLDELDIALLQELTLNSRRKNTEIMDSLHLDKTITGLPQKISRKLIFLEKEIVSHYRVFLRWETFEIYNSFLAICECDEIISNKLQNLLIKEPIPFESTFKVTDNGFLWYLRCPASHFSNASAIIWQLSKKVQFYFLDYKKSQLYGLWKEAFDFSTHQWSIELMKKEKIL